MATGIASIIFATVVYPAVATPPPVPGPPSQQIDAARDLWAGREIPPAAFDYAMITAAYQIGGELLLARKADRRKSYTKSLIWLAERLRSHGEDSVQILRDRTNRCMADSMAFLTVEQTSDLKKFAATESGTAFWNYYVANQHNPVLVACIKHELSEVSQPYFDADVREALKVR